MKVNEINFKEPCQQYLKDITSELNTLLFKDKFNIELFDWYFYITLHINTEEELTIEEESDINKVLKYWNIKGERIFKPKDKNIIVYAFSMDYTKMDAEIRRISLTNLL